MDEVPRAPRTEFCIRFAVCAAFAIPLQELKQCLSTRRDHRGPGQSACKTRQDKPLFIAMQTEWPWLKRIWGNNAPDQTALEELSLIHI